MVKKETSKILRGVAILIVIASHYAEWMGEGNAVHPALAHAVSTWGPLGVDAFMLLSGYGLYKSADKNGISLSFVWRRLSASYIPYLLVATVLALITHELQPTNLGWVYNFLTAQDYWFMSVLMVMYLAFIICFRLFKKLRIPVLTVLVAAFSVWLYYSGHMDFWTLSNHSFVLGAAAAAAEIRFPKLFTRRNLLLVTIGALALAVAAFFLKQKNGGSGIDESYEAELVMNVFISTAVMSGAYLLPDIELRLLGLIGEASLFIYVLHTTMFYAIIFKLEKLGYTLGTVITGIITMALAVLLFKLYSVFSKYVLTRIKKKLKKRFGAGRDLYYYL